MHGEPGSQVEDRLAASHVSSQANRHFAYFNKWLKARNTRGAVAAAAAVPPGSAASIAGLSMAWPPCSQTGRVASLQCLPRVNMIFAAVVSPLFPHLQLPLCSLTAWQPQVQPI